MEYPLHITSGDIAGEALAKSGLPGEVFVWHDILYDGPRCPGWPDGDTLNARAAFLENATAGGLDRQRVLKTLRRQYQRLAEAAPGGHIVLWFDACLFDQRSGQRSTRSRRANAFDGNPGPCGQAASMGEQRAAGEFQNQGLAEPAVARDSRPPRVNGIVVGKKENDMTTKEMIAIAAASALLTATGIAGEIAPGGLIEKVEAAYKSMQTYKSEGTIAADIDAGGMRMNTVTSFSILLKKPNQYLVSWTQKNMPMPGMTQSGSVWSDGTQPYLYMGIMNAYSKIGTDEMALSSATGISGGAAFTVPALFLPVFKGEPSPFSRLEDPRIEKIEMVENDECYVLSSPSAISKRETYWISKTNYAIRKYERSLEPPEGGFVMPEMTDDQLEAAVKGMGQEVTEESMKNMREMVERSSSMLKTLKMKGSSTEIHVNVSFPELDKGDFRFDFPEGAILRDSLFGGMFGADE